MFEALNIPNCYRGAEGGGKGAEHEQCGLLCSAAYSQGAIILSLPSSDSTPKQQPGLCSCFLLSFRQEGRTRATVPHLCRAQRSPDVCCQELPRKQNSSERLQTALEETPQIQHSLPACSTPNMAVSFRD